MSAQRRLCPSAPPGIAEARIFGVAAGCAEQPKVSYLAEPLPVPEGLSDVLAPLAIGEVFRVAAPCQSANCVHGDGATCKLIEKLVRTMEAVTDALPACRIRPHCLWWAQRGRDACVRCPQVVTISAPQDKVP